MNVEECEKYANSAEIPGKVLHENITRNKETIAGFREESRNRDT